MSATRPAAHFKTVAQLDVPNSRKGKHREIVSLILRDLDQLKEGAAIKIALESLGDTKINVRSAVNRAARKAKRNVATASDDNYLYVWNETKT